jgi:hypothetical protein
MFDKLKNAASNLGDLGEVGDLRQYVEGVSFPASKDEIVSQLERSGAREDLVARVRGAGKERFADQGDLLATIARG